jgi:hypothetical protein
MDVQLGQLVGNVISVRTREGTCTGRLLSVNRQSAWLLVDGEDRFIPRGDILKVGEPWTCP